MKRFLSVLVLSAGLLFSTGTLNAKGLENVLLGEYIKCYVAVGYGEGFASTLGHTVYGNMVPTGTGDFYDVLTVLKPGVKLSELTAAVGSQDVLKMIELLDSYVVVARDTNNEDFVEKKNKMYDFYLFTPKGAYTYTFNQEILEKENEGRSSTKTFLLTPDKIGYRFPVRYYESIGPWDKYRVAVPNFTTDRPSIPMKGVYNTDNSLYHQVLLKRIQDALEPNYMIMLSKDSMSEKEYLAITTTCRSIMEAVPSVKTKIESLKPKAKTAEKK